MLTSWSLVARHEVLPHRTFEQWTLGEVAVALGGMTAEQVDHITEEETAVSLKRTGGSR
jgi:hypothetical protein